MPTNSQLNGQCNFRANFTGNSKADFILGLPGDTSRRLGDIKSYMFNSTYGGFAQDDYRITSRMTLNFGLRYELMPPQYEKYGQYANFIPALGKLIIASDSTVPNLQQTLAANGLTGKVALAKDYGLPYTFAKSLDNSSQFADNTQRRHSGGAELAQFLDGSRPPARASRACATGPPRFRIPPATDTPIQLQFPVTLIIAESWSRSETPLRKGPFWDAPGVASVKGLGDFIVGAAGSDHPE
jgi:hypothetical protein